MPGNSELLTQSILSLLLVLAIMVGLLYVSKWFMQRRPRGGRRLRFIEAMALGNKEKLILVELDQRQLLIGVSPQQVTLLSEVENPDANQFAQHLAEQVAKDGSQASGQINSQATKDSKQDEASS